MDTWRHFGNTLDYKYMTGIIEDTCWMQLDVTRAGVKDGVFFRLVAPFKDLEEKKEREEQLVEEMKILLTNLDSIDSEEWILFAEDQMDYEANE